MENVHRTASGEISHQKGARPELDMSEQPHRRFFARLGAAGDWRAGFALGRLRILGQVEEQAPAGKDDTCGPVFVRRLLFSGHKNAPKGPFGISERLFFAGMKCAETVGRERWVRASPKDKPQAMAFMVARGIDLSARELSNEQAQNYVARYEEMNAALLSTPCSPDVRRALRMLRFKARKLGRVADDMIRILQGLGALMNPAMSGAVKRSVELVVLDDRDPNAAELDLARAGLTVLADHFFGPERDDRRDIVGWTDERPTWPHDERVIEILYPDGQGGVRPAHQVPERHAAKVERESGKWKDRHRSHAGG